MNKRTVASFVISLAMVLSLSACGIRSNETMTKTPSSTTPTTTSVANSTTITPTSAANRSGSYTITINSEKWSISDQPNFLKDDYDTFSSIMNQKTKLYYLYYWKNKENKINADELYLILDDKSAQYYAKINNTWYYKTEVSNYANSNNSEDFGSDYDCYGLNSLCNLPDYEIVIDETKIVVGDFKEYLGHELYYNKAIGHIYDIDQTAKDTEFYSGDYHLTIYEGDLKNAPVQSLDFTSYTKFDRILQFRDVNFDGTVDMEIWGNNTCTIPVVLESK